MTAAPAASRISRFASGDESHRTRWRHPGLTPRMPARGLRTAAPSDSGNAINIHPAKWFLLTNGPNGLPVVFRRPEAQQPAVVKRLLHDADQRESDAEDRERLDQRPRGWPTSHRPRQANHQDARSAANSDERRPGSPAIDRQRSENGVRPAP